MCDILRFVDDNIIDFFIQEAEGGSDGRDKFLEQSPYLLGDGELYGFPGYFPEQPADGLVITEASGDREEVVLEATDRRRGYLGGERRALAFAKSQVPLAVGEDHLQAPSPGIYLPGLEEIHVHVRGEQPVPSPMPRTSDKEDPDIHATEYGIEYDIVALELAAVSFQAEALPPLDHGGRREVSVSGTILRLAVLAHLDHT